MTQRKNVIKNMTGGKPNREIDGNKTSDQPKKSWKKNDDANSAKDGCIIAMTNALH